MKHIISTQQFIQVLFNLIKDFPFGFDEMFIILKEQLDNINIDYRDDILEQELILYYKNNFNITIQPKHKNNENANPINIRVSRAGRTA